MIMIFIFLKFYKRHCLPTFFILLAMLELAIEFWLLVIWSVIMAVKFIF